MKQLLLKLSICLIFTVMSVHASHQNPWVILDSTDDLNGCKVRLSARTTPHNQIAPGSKVWEVYDPGFNEESDDFDALRVESCEFTGNLLMTRLERAFDHNQMFKVLYAFLYHATDPQRQYKQIFAWIPKIKKKQLSEEYIVFTKGFGFQEDKTQLICPASAKVLVVPEGLTQVSASRGDISAKLTN